MNRKQFEENYKINLKEVNCVEINCYSSDLIFNFDNKEVSFGLNKSYGTIHLVKKDFYNDILKIIKENLIEITSKYYINNINSKCIAFNKEIFFVSWCKNEYYEYYNEELNNKSLLLLKNNYKYLYKRNNILFYFNDCSIFDFKTESIDGTLDKDSYCLNVYAEGRDLNFIFNYDEDEIKYFKKFLLINMF